MLNIVAAVVLGLIIYEGLEMVAKALREVAKSVTYINDRGYKWAGNKHTT